VTPLRILATACALMLGVWLALAPQEAKANVVCSVGTSSISFGSSSSASAAVNYTCTNYNKNAETFTLCSALGTPSYPGTTAQPKLTNNSSTINFNLYTNAARTQVWTSTAYISTTVSIAGGSGNVVSGTIPYYGTIAAGQTPPPSSYSASFYNTVLGFIVSGSTTCQTSPNGNYSALQYTLSVSAAPTNACTVTAGTASKIDFGTVSFSAANLAATSNIVVNCPSGTAYYIGLRPSNASTTGAGQLSGTGSNTTKVAYQLRSTSGTSGTVWGNTATSTSAGNGIGGTGTGANRTLPVYATVGSANVQPDVYGDTVTITVNY
jgi:spore coat protein U-like protein